MLHKNRYVLYTSNCFPRFKFGEKKVTVLFPLEYYILRIVGLFFDTDIFTVISKH